MLHRITVIVVVTRIDLKFFILTNPMIFACIFQAYLQLVLTFHNLQLCALGQIVVRCIKLGSLIPNSKV